MVRSPGGVGTDWKNNLKYTWHTITWNILWGEKCSLTKTPSTSFSFSQKSIGVFLTVS